MANMDIRMEQLWMETNKQLERIADNLREKQLDDFKPISFSDVVKKQLKGEISHEERLKLEEFLEAKRKVIEHERSG